MMPKGQKWAPCEDAVSYLYKKKPTRRKPALYQTSLFPNRDVLPDGAILMDGTEVRLVPTDLTKGKPLYVTQDGQGYSYQNGQFRKVKSGILTPGKHCSPGRTYLIFQNKGSIYVHQAVLSAWVGPCPEGYECDHINGDTHDNRVKNLEWVSHEENIRRRWLHNSKKGLSYLGKKLTSEGRHYWKMRKQTAKKYGVSVELALGATLAFDNEIALTEPSVLRQAH